MSNPVNTDDFISELVADLKPVKRFPSFGAWVAQSSVVAGVSILCAILFLGARDDLMGHVLTWNYLTPAMMFAALAAISVLAARYFSVPGNEDSKTLPLSAFVVVAAWLGIIAYEIAKGPADSVDDGVACTCNMFVFSLPLYVALAHLVYRGAPIRLHMAGLSVSVAGASVGALCSYLVCSSDSALHVFIWHFLPFVLLGTSGIFISSLFNWQRRATFARTQSDSSR